MTQTTPTGTREQSDIYAARFKDAPWYRPFGKSLDVSIYGAGGIGSWLSLLVSRMGHVTHIIDNDYVEAHNLGGQLYAMHSIGQPKVEEVASICWQLSPNARIHPYNHRINTDNVRTFFSPVTFLAFDNMKGRKLVAENWIRVIRKKRADGKARQNDINILIDGRMEAETAIIYCVNSLSRYDRYIEEFFDDEEVPDNPCSFRATSHNPAIMAGWMVGVLNNHVYNKVMGEEIREVPFKIEYELPTMTYTAIR